MPIALFVLGLAGSGKTRFSKEFIKSRIKKKEPWCLIDKDTTGEILSNELMISYGLNPNDRDSPEYKKRVRDLEYKTALKIAKEQLKLNINVILPAPWTKELETGEIFDYKKLGFPKNTKIKHVYMESNVEQIKERIILRNKPRDKWKLNNWEVYSQSLVEPKVIEDKNILKVNKEYEIELISKKILNPIFNY